MIDNKMAALLVQRFMILANFPKNVRDQNELIKAMKQCPNEFMATNLTNVWIESEEFCPRPVDLYRLIGQEKDRLAALPHKKCQVCDGAGAVITHGYGKLDPTVLLTGARLCEKCHGSGQAQEQASQDACRRCGGHGLYGGELSGKFAGPWKWCNCPAALDRIERETSEIAGGKGINTLKTGPRTMDSVVEGNIAREKLLRRFPAGIGRSKREDRMKHVSEIPPDDGYRGDF